MVLEKLSRNFWQTIIILAGIFIIFLIVYAGFFFKSCSKPYVKISEPSYAAAITEEVLITRNAIDYDKYLTLISDDSRKFKTEEMFKSSVYFVKSSWGDYIPGSITFKEAWLDRTFNETLKLPYYIKYISVYYNARFTKNPDIDVPISVNFFETKGLPEFESIGFNVSG